MGCCPPDSWISASLPWLWPPAKLRTTLSGSAGSPFTEPYFLTPFWYIRSQSEPVQSLNQPSSICLLSAIAHPADLLLPFLSRLALRPHMLLDGRQPVAVESFLSNLNCPLLTIKFSSHLLHRLCTVLFRAVTRTACQRKRKKICYISSPGEIA